MIVIVKFNVGNLDKYSKILGLIFCDLCKKVVFGLVIVLGDDEVICVIDIDFVLIVLFVFLYIGEIVVFDVENNCVYIFIVIGDY